ncbi:hypothetical protein F4824DRAFT_507434 [Ustulina deusta]|nr:hypothetical protein F4824DRAFT_507434 [Ustulina deusta]
MSGNPSPPEYIGWRLEIFVGIFTALQVIIVYLRFYARSLTASPYGLNDWLVLAALFSQLQGAVGYHTEYLEQTNPAAVTLFLKYLVAVSIWYVATIGISKLSICMLYRRLFPQRSVFVILCITVGILIGTSIAGVFAGFLACRPFWTNWGPPSIQKTHCIDKQPLFVWSTLPNIITDVIMLAIPLPLVWRLQASTSLKIALTFTFLIGSIGLVASILRLMVFYRTNAFVDATYHAVELQIWTLAEPGIYLISACLLVYRPLLEKVHVGVSLLRSKVATSTASRSRSDNYELGRARYSRQHDDSQSNRTGVFNQSHGGME